jgi:hypothetical protein
MGETVVTTSGRLDRGYILLHTFFFSLNPSCMKHVQMCAGGDLMEKTLTEAAQLLQKTSKAAAMRRDCET